MGVAKYSFVSTVAGLALATSVSAREFDEPQGTTPPHPLPHGETVIPDAAIEFPESEMPPMEYCQGSLDPDNEAGLSDSHYELQETSVEIGCLLLQQDDGVDVSGELSLIMIELELKMMKAQQDAGLRMEGSIGGKLDAEMAENYIRVSMATGFLNPFFDAYDPDSDLGREFARFSEEIKSLAPKSFAVAEVLTQEVLTQNAQQDLPFTQQDLPNPEIFQAPEQSVEPYIPLFAESCFYPYHDDTAIPFNSHPGQVTEMAKTVGCLLLMQDRGDDVAGEMERAVMDLQEMVRDNAIHAGVTLNDSSLYAGLDGKLGPNTAKDTILFLERISAGPILLPIEFLGETHELSANLERFSAALQELQPIDHTRLVTETRRFFNLDGQEDVPEMPEEGIAPEFNEEVNPTEPDDPGPLPCQLFDTPDCYRDARLQGQTGTAFRFG
jgi:hypothetical protein